jgi:hypothetical protein
VLFSRILSFEGSITNSKKDPSLRSGQALNSLGREGTDED